MGVGLLLGAGLLFGLGTQFSRQPEILLNYKDIFRKQVNAQTIAYYRKQLQDRYNQETNPQEKNELRQAMAELEDVARERGLGR